MKANSINPIVVGSIPPKITISLTIVKITSPDWVASILNYTVKSLKHFKDKIVLISSGGNSAIDWANELEPIAKKVYVTYRKDVLAGHEAQVTQLMNSSAVCYLNTSITKLIVAANHEAIEYVELTNKQTGETSCVRVDKVVINHGYQQDA